MRGELLNETLFFGLDHARSTVAGWVADHNAARPHSALGYQTPTALAAQLAAVGDRPHETEPVRQAPIALPRKRTIVTHRLRFQVDECRGSQQAHCIFPTASPARRRDKARRLQPRAVQSW